ncbi:hypothetical protein V8C34DRAFT_137259 [Trichoderma compactum]
MSRWATETKPASASPCAFACACAVLISGFRTAPLTAVADRTTTLLHRAAIFSGLGEGMLAFYLVLLCCASLVRALMCSETIDTGRVVWLSTCPRLVMLPHLPEDADKRAFCELHLFDLP